jgi:ergothioneine biosynthesis protein EgtC
MCRFVTYLGQAVTLERVISAPEHSLMVQSYKPVEMTSGVVNADGFGVGWYNRALDPTPCVYTNSSPIWSDRNLTGLSKHIASDCVFANVRSATADVAVDQSNCQPFAYRQLLFMHNGYVENFRFTLMRRIRETLRDEYYTAIGGTTDSEHIFALLLNTLHGRPVTLPTLVEVVSETIEQLSLWASCIGIQLALNIAVTNGEGMVVSRFATRDPAPSLYCITKSSFFPNATVVASEQLFPSPQWITVPVGSVVAFDKGLEPHIHALPCKGST